MADYAITAANVLKGVNGKTKSGIAGVTIIAGQALYKAADNSLKLFKSNVAAPVNMLEGIALHGSLTGQPIAYVYDDDAFSPGTTIAAGATVIGSGTNAGGICPDADKASGWRLTEVGHGVGGNLMSVKIVTTGADVP
jgi:hypothetical protein